MPSKWPCRYYWPGAIREADAVLLNLGHICGGEDVHALLGKRLFHELRGLRGELGQDALFRLDDVGAGIHAFR